MKRCDGDYLLGILSPPKESEASMEKNQYVIRSYGVLLRIGLWLLVPLRFLKHLLVVCGELAGHASGSFFSTLFLVWGEQLEIFFIHLFQSAATQDQLDQL